MNLVYGRVIEINEEDGIRIGRVLIGGARRKVALELLSGVSCGDKILICDGVAISRVQENVSGHSRKAY
ncbi:MAG TPA: HypC/HybG/HupF family hydrogenase formation chaperone [Chthoniobacterales bacterium]|jgi:hydrogenase maturation factor|nr:HypC/HybG/HupF family hydrogenase formation chaperone [Chthoniobacterales bacterium]